VDFLGGIEILAQIAQNPSFNKISVFPVFEP